MEQKKIVETRNCELLCIDMKNVMKNMREQERIYDFKTTYAEEDLLTAIDKSLHVEVEEISDREKRNRAVFQKKDGTGIYISIKNVQFNPIEFMLGIIDLVDGEFAVLTIATLIINILKQIGISINKKQMIICSVIFYEGKQQALSDENVMEIVNKYMKLYSYNEMEAYELNEILEKLLKLGIIQKKNDSYTTNQKFYFMEQGI